MFTAISNHANEMIATLKRMNMREATDAHQKAMTVVHALDRLEQNFPSAELEAHGYAGFSGYFLNVPDDMRLYMLSFAYMYSATHDCNQNHV